jgi:di/tricarboxylate transporter
MAALVVGMATSNSFILPTHQVNALYMGPGHYRSVDFMKAGGVLSAIFIAVLIAAIYLFYL